MESFIVEKKRGRINGRGLLEKILLRLPDGFYKVTVTKQRHGRSSRQNRWLWGQIYPRLLQGFLDAGWRDFICEDEVHEYCKIMFAGKAIVDPHSGEIVTLPCRTREMNTMEFALYCEQLRIFAYDMLNVTIPEPGTELLQED